MYLGAVSLPSLQGLRSVPVRRVLHVGLVLVTLCLGYFVRLQPGQPQRPGQQQRPGQPQQPGWIICGPDGYNYLSAASELVTHHRYAMRPPPQLPQPATPPLSSCRQPGYPLLLALSARGPSYQYEELFAHVAPVQRVLDLLTCLLCFLLGRGIGGLRTGWLALLFAVGNPWLIVFASSALTESLATFLCMLTLFLVHRAASDKTSHKHSLIALCGAGVAVGLSALTRADGVLLLPCLAIPVLLRSEPLRTRLQSLGLSVLCAVVIFLPWPLRNLVQLGTPHAFSSLCDTHGRAVPYAGYGHWVRTWLTQESQLAPYYCLLTPECRPSIQQYPKEAFASAAEQQEVAALLLLRDTPSGATAIDQGFRKLALRRVKARPLHNLLTLPLVRAYQLYVYRSDWPLRTLLTRIAAPLRTLWRPGMSAILSGGLALLAGIGLLLLLLRPQSDEQRRFARLSLLTIGLRTSALALAGYVENRYLVELHPLLAILSALAITQVLTLRRAPDRTATTP